jgi:methionyl-tRNA formyltransferase
MKTLFMGTTDFAVACLDAMIKAGYAVSAVCTKADRPKNRGMKMAFSPVKEYALKAGIPILQPESLKTEETLSALRAVGADLFVVVAYGKLLPPAVLEMPRLGCINVHGSLLPKYRGAAPIQWAVLNGEKKRGVSVMYLAEGMDSGDVIDTLALDIGEGESFGSVYERMKLLGGEGLVRTLPRFENGKPPATPQAEAEVTYAPPILKEHTLIDWTWDAGKVSSRICGLDPKPGARGVIGSTEFKLFSPVRTDSRTELPPGSVVARRKDGLEIACGGGETLLIRELQAPGGKRMRAADYLRGHQLA